MDGELLPTASPCVSILSISLTLSLMASLSSPFPPSYSLSSSRTHRNLHLITCHLPSSSSSAHFPLPKKPKSPSELSNPVAVPKWRAQVSFFPSFLKKKGKSKEEIKQELFKAIEPLERGAEATPEDQERIEQIVRELEAVNPTKEPLKSDLLNGKWELIYTTSRSILQSQRPKFLRPNGKIYQAINADTLRGQNMETWPYFNQVTANLTPLNARKVAVQFDTFKIGGLIPIKAPARARGELEITYLDEELRVSRGDKGNLFILKMADPSYRIPL